MPGPPAPSLPVAFLFDMDGVIVDSNPFHTRAWIEYLWRAGLAVEDVEARMMGKRNDEIVRDFFGPSVSDDDIFTHGAAKEALYRELIAPELPVHLIPGVAEFLDRYPGVPTGLGTNAEPANVSFVLGAAGLQPRFRVIIDGSQVERPKPHPEVYLRVAAGLGVPPERCIVFEDSVTGVQAARAAGAYVVGIQSNYREFPIPVDLAIPDFRDARLHQWLCRFAPPA